MSLGGGLKHGVRPMPSGPICIPAATSDKGHTSIPRELQRTVLGCSWRMSGRTRRSDRDASRVPPVVENYQR